MGRVEGLSTPDQSTIAPGNFLLNTYCFCAVPGQYSEANYIQIEYYNWHQNTIFISLAPLPRPFGILKSPALCLGSSTGLSYHNGIDLGRFCRSCYNTLNGAHLHLYDELCYELDSVELWLSFGYCSFGYGGLGDANCIMAYRNRRKPTLLATAFLF